MTSIRDIRLVHRFKVSQKDDDYLVNQWWLFIEIQEGFVIVLVFASSVQDFFINLPLLKTQLILIILETLYLS